MSAIKTLGIDLAKNIFQLAGADSTGKRILKKRLKREQFIEFMSNLTPCKIGMEACGSANYFARKFRSFGHEVKLMSPLFVKAYVQGNKNDMRDADAILEALHSPRMPAVAIKELEHEDMQMLHKLRLRAVGNRTAAANQFRGFLMEYGEIIPRGPTFVKKHAINILTNMDNELTPKARRLLTELYEEFIRLDDRVKLFDREIAQEAASRKELAPLQSVEGVGPVIATAFWSIFSDPQTFKNGRAASAYLGLVPGQSSSGDKTKLLGISKRGNIYLRTMLIHGARAFVTASARLKTERQKKVVEMVNRCGFNKTVVAVANKNARILLALLKSGEAYRGAVTC